jgi:aminomethyltransferase
MPLQYPKGIIHEHLHCRSQVGFFDISHMGQCRVLRDNAASAIDKLTPGGISDLKVGAQKYTVLTNAEAGVIDDIIVTRIDAGLSIIVNAGCKDKDFAYLKHSLPDDCRFDVCADLALFALHGPAAAGLLGKYSVDTTRLCFMHSCVTQIAGIVCVVSRSGYTGEDGFEISLNQANAEQLARLLLAEPNVEPIGLGARDTLRLEAGLCLYGHELNDNISPIEARLQWLIKKGHSDFPGANVIFKQMQQGAERVRVGLLIDGKIPVREGCALHDAEGKAIGFVTSGSYSPSLSKPVAMALIDRRYAEIGSVLYATVRNTRIMLTVSRLPFVPHRYQR